MEKNLHRDTFFKDGLNNTSVYNNNVDYPVVSRTRVAASSDIPTDSSYMMEIVTSGPGSTPGLGGFHQNTMSYSGAIFYQVILAKIPVGYTITRASNSCGDGYTTDYLTSREGTGKWELYAWRYNCGTTGSFASFGHVYLSGTAPVTWHVAAATIFDATGVTVNSASATHAMDATTRIAQFFFNIR